MLFMTGYRSCSLRTWSGHARWPCPLVRQPRRLRGASVCRRRPSPCQRVICRWMSLIARSSRGRWRQEHMQLEAEVVRAPSVPPGRRGGHRGGVSGWDTGQVSASRSFTPFSLSVAGGASLLLCWGCSSVGPALRDCSGRSGGGNLLQSDFCSQMKGGVFFPLPQACLRRFSQAEHADLQAVQPHPLK